MFWFYIVVPSIAYLLIFSMTYQWYRSKRLSHIDEHNLKYERKYGKAISIVAGLFWPVLFIKSTVSELFSVVFEAFQDMFTSDEVKKKEVWFTTGGGTRVGIPHDASIADVMGLIKTVVNGGYGIFTPDEELFHRFKAAVEELQEEEAIKVVTYLSEWDSGKWPSKRKFLILPKGMEARDWCPDDAIQIEDIPTVEG